MSEIVLVDYVVCMMETCGCWPGESCSWYMIDWTKGPANKSLMSGITFEAFRGETLDHHQKCGIEQGHSLLSSESSDSISHFPLFFDITLRQVVTIQDQTDQLKTHSHQCKVTVRAGKSESGSRNPKVVDCVVCPSCKSCREKLHTGSTILDCTSCRRSTGSL